MNTRIFLIPLVSKMRIASDGVGASTVEIPLDVAKFTNVLPFAASLTLHSLTEGAPASNELEWNVGFRSGFTRDNETGVLTLLASSISTNGSVRHPPVTDLSKFQLVSRLVITVQNKAGVNGLRSALVSAALAVETVGQ
jgi:hypothetical protein